MHLIPVKCPDCGADVKLPEGKTQLTCEYCGGSILVADLLGSTSVMQNCMTLAYEAINDKNYEDAYDHFNRAIEIDMKNPYALMGKAVCLGMTGKLADNIFNKMTRLHENAFSYATVDKLPNLKKTAAADIVKVVRKNKAFIHMAKELIVLNGEDEFTAELKKNYDELIQSTKEIVNKAVEYDSLSKDVSDLNQEVVNGKFFED